MVGSLVILYRRQDSLLPVGVHAAVGWRSLTGGSRVTSCRYEATYGRFASVYSRCAIRGVHRRSGLVTSLLGTAAGLKELYIYCRRGVADDLFPRHHVRNHLFGIYIAFPDIAFDKTTFP